MERPYPPEEYPELLCDYMKDAYEALEREDHHHYALAVSKITMELKFLTKSQYIREAEAQEMKAYFWSKVK